MTCAKKTLLILMIICWISADLASVSAKASEKGKRFKKRSSQNGLTDKAVGIDFGSSHIRVGVLNNGKVEILKNDQGSELTPTYVAFTSNGHRLMGDEAKSQLTTNPQSTVFSVMPILARTFDDETVHNHSMQIPYVIFSSSSKPAIDVKIEERTESFAPEEILAMLLRKMKDIAERHLKEVVANVVVSLPSCLRYTQRRAMRDAGKIAGFKQMHLVNAHMTTVLAHVTNSDEYGEKLFVFDLGGNSLGASVIDIADGAIETKVQDGICNFGGELFEQRVMEYLMKLFEKKKGVFEARRLRQNSGALQKLRREVERAIRQLSSDELIYVEVDSLIDGEDFAEALTRARFEELNNDLFKSALDLVERVLEKAKASIEDIDEVLIVGGSSRIPMIRRMLQNLFTGLEPNHSIDTDKSSAIGATVWAGILGGSQFADGTSASLKTGISSSFVLMDSCSQSFGYRLKSGLYEAVIQQNVPIPTEGFDYGTVQGTSANLVVFEGEQYMALDKNVVGSVKVQFPPTVEPNISITFSLNSQYILKVTLKEINTGAVASETFDHGISLSEMKRMNRRLQTLDNHDRWESERLTARDSLESLANLMKHRLHKERLESGGGFKTGGRLMAERATLRAIDWLETNYQAGAEEIAMKRRELKLAEQRVEL